MKMPTDEQVAERLMTNYSQLEAIRQHISGTLGETREEWKFYGQKLGWTLKNFYKKRNLFFITVGDGYFRFSMVFGEKAYRVIKIEN